MQYSERLAKGVLGSRELLEGFGEVVVEWLVVGLRRWFLQKERAGTRAEYDR